MPSGSGDSGGRGSAPIFISYRRKDAAASARGLYLLLRSWFGEAKVFYDHAGLAAGDLFSDKLKDAIRGSRITLAVMGPDWLKEVNRRARETPAAVDVVREELKLALELQQADAANRWVIPVLMECDAMPPEAELDVSLHADLGPLWRHNACSLGGDQGRWDQAVKALLRRIEDTGALLPLPTAGDGVRVDVAQEEVQEAMAMPEMEPLRAAWGADPLHGVRIDEVEDLVAAFARGVDKALPAWRGLKLSNDALVEVKRRCRDILSALYGLAIDSAAARAWVEEPDGARPVPVASAEALCFAHAVVNSKRARISESLDNIAGFLPEGTVDLGEPDPGGGQRRRRAVHHTLWLETMTDPRTAYPRGNDPLAQDDLNVLGRRLKARARIEGRAFIVTEKQAPEGQAESDLQAIADELGIIALPRTGTDRGLLRVNEEDFNALMAECLKRIERIR